MEENMKPNFGYQYPRPAVTADCVVFCFDVKEEQLKLLLIERRDDPFKHKPSLPGGFMEIKCETNAEGMVISEVNECLLDTAKRELKEETGLKVAFWDEVGAWSTPGRDPRCITISDVFLGLTLPREVKGADDAASAQWVPFKQVLNAIENMPEGMHFMAFDHDEIVLKAYRHLQREICFTPMIFQLLPKQFSMTNLQRVYEAVLGREFDRRNFSRKMLDADILDPSPAGVRMISYQFNPKKYADFLKYNKLTNLIF